MSTPILATKLHIPPARPQRIPRPHLIERLNAGQHRRLTLLSAPAGFGKSTLVSEWVAGCDRPAAWLSLDNGDNDPTRFLAYLIAALQTLALPGPRRGSGAEGIAPNIGSAALGILHASQPQPPSNESILTSLLNEVATIPQNFTLVLDDYHAIDSKQIDRALAFLIDGLPPQMHLVIATREDPDLPLARYRARGQLTELRVTDLRFTLSEAAEFLHQMAGPNLPPDDIAALEARTEGWIACLQLAAISMQGHPDAASFIKSFTGSHRFVMDFLVEEVLQQQPENIQAFLLQTSLLDRLCGPLCDALLPDPASGGQEILESLERANLLILPLDDRREWYRYHPLFADVLQARLLKEQPGRAAVLHKRACAWFEQNNFRSDAIRHALAARDFEHAADLVELERSVTIGKSFQSATWLGWVKALPDELVRERAGLSLGFAWECLFSGELEAADARLNDADRLLSQPADPNDPLKVSSAGRMVVNEEELRSQRVSFAIARAYLAQALGNVPATEKHARQALALIPARDHSDRALASAMLGITCLSTGDLETAYGYMADSVASLRMTGNLVFANSGTYVLAEIRIAQGRLWDAIRTYEQALQLVTAQGNLLVEGTADLYLGLSKLYREQGNPEAASRHLQRAQELGKQAALPEWPYQLYLARAPLKEDQGDLEGALALLDEAERLHHRSPVPDLHPISAWKTRVWIRQGRLAEAIHWTQGRRLSVNDELSYRREFEHVTLARVLIACYKSDRTEHYMQEALGLVERLLRAAEEGGRLRSVIEILLLQVLAQEAQGNIAPALASLERALTLAEPEGYVRIFVDEGLPILGVLKKMKGQTGTMRAYVHKLLAAFGRPEEAYPASLTSQLLIEPLSERELEVLQLLAQGLSNHEIGRRLFVALDTVKGHNRKIFDKLGVKRRTEAVARARELGLL